MYCTCIEGCYNHTSPENLLTHIIRDLFSVMLLSGNLSNGDGPSGYVIPLSKRDGPSGYVINLSKGDGPSRTVTFK